MLKIAATCLVLLQGCTVLAPDNELRVTEYDGRGWYMTASGVATGCRVVRAGTVKGCLVYEGTTCTYQSEGCE